MFEIIFQESLSPQALQLIRSKLPKGYRQMIKDRTHYTVSHIDRVLAGQRVNQKVIDAALDIIEEHELAKQACYERINRIANAG